MIHGLMLCIRQQLFQHKAIQFTPEAITNVVASKILLEEISNV